MQKRGKASKDVMFKIRNICVNTSHEWRVWWKGRYAKSNVVIFYGEAHVIYAGVEGRIEK